MGCKSCHKSSSLPRPARGPARVFYPGTKSNDGYYGLCMKTGRHTRVPSYDVTVMQRPAKTYLPCPGGKAFYKNSIHQKILADQRSASVRELETDRDKIASKEKDNQRLSLSK